MPRNVRAVRCGYPRTHRMPPPGNAFQKKTTTCAREPVACHLPIQGVDAFRKTLIVAGIICAPAINSPRAQANDLEDLYRLARARDAVLASATFQRDAASEAKPQAIA